MRPLQRAFRGMFLSCQVPRLKKSWHEPRQINMPLLTVKDKLASERIPHSFFAKSFFEKGKTPYSPKYRIASSHRFLP